MSEEIYKAARQEREMDEFAKAIGLPKFMRPKAKPKKKAPREYVPPQRWTSGPTRADTQAASVRAEAARQKPWSPPGTATPRYEVRGGDVYQR